MLRKPILPFLALICALGLLLAGCRTSPPADNGTPAATPISEELHSGGLTVQLSLSNSQISIAESLQLTLTAIAPEDFEVSFPEFTGSALGDFTLAGTTSPPKELIGAQLRQSLTLTLTPYLPGEYSIPAMTVSARDKQHPDRQATVTIAAHTIQVSSFLDSNEKDPQIIDIYSPLALPLPTLYYLLAGGAVVLLLALLFYFRRRRRRLQPPPPPVPLHVAALTEIDRLLQEQGAGNDFALFYVRLTLILRHYIEARFGLKAPEQTTEEFLESLRHSPVFSKEQKELLRDFLGRCDLIKFARIIPDRQEVDASIELCRDFIRASGEKVTPSSTGEGLR
ncbi:MAG: BatD family protein [Proteobacteria bacterium]|nr:BatD family protein [Pseudomonadota bacterium]MBU4294578.1 BatD family protein [Pseudomonadota bacterium]MCG2747114.1 BatD family protein [Desulfobulbaceae bacterium]